MDILLRNSVLRDLILIAFYVYVAKFFKHTIEPENFPKLSFVDVVTYLQVLKNVR